MSAKQLRGLVGAGLPPSVIFGPRKWGVGAKSRAGGEGGGMLPLSLHTHSLGAGVHGAGGRRALHQVPPSHGQSEAPWLLAGSLPWRRHKPAAIPLAAPSRPTTVTSSIPGGHRSLGMAASVRRKGARGERSSLGMPGCITRLPSQHPHQLPQEAAAGLCSAAGNPRSLAPVRRGREKSSLAGGNSPS